MQKLTLPIHLDMCAFGLRIPNTQLFLRKRSHLLSTSEFVQSHLHDRKCPQTRQHVSIAGSYATPTGGLKLSKFCATYCKGFANQVARVILDTVDDPVNYHPNMAFAHQDIEGEPASKRRRVDDVFHPSTLTLRPDVLSFGDEVPPEQHDVWKRIFQDAHRLAPRVGNRKIQLDDPTFIAFREINPQIQWTHLFVCRGTERFQVPLDSPSTSEADVRHTWRLHRQTLKLLDMGEDNWSNLTRAQKIRASVPSRLTLTAFGRRSDSLAERAPRSHESHEHGRPPAGTPDEEQTFRDVPAVDPRYIDRHIAVPQSEQELGKQISIPEGWAPPPTPIHGPAFRRLSRTRTCEAT